MSKRLHIFPLLSIRNAQEPQECEICGEDIEGSRYPIMTTVNEKLVVDGYVCHGCYAESEDTKIQDKSLPQMIFFTHDPYLVN